MALVKKVKTNGSKLKVPSIAKSPSMPPSKAKKRGGGDGYMAMMAPKLKNIGKK